MEVLGGFGVVLGGFQRDLEGFGKVSGGSWEGRVRGRREFSGPLIGRKVGRGREEGEVRE